MTERNRSEAKLREAYGEIARLKEELERERDYLREEVDVSMNFGRIVGESPALAAMLTRIEAVAGTPANVLIIGETGTGKELVAHAIHGRSQRADAPLVKVNCASIPHELFESEFFGHVKGAFTGAYRDRVGRFQLADGGTIFLDEVGEIPVALQGKLLRVLQEKEFERVGDDVTRRVDVRVIAATNRDLEQLVEAGKFREDLYYRLSVFPVQVPPLRRRRDDVVQLALHFLEQACRDFGRGCPKLTRSGGDTFAGRNPATGPVTARGNCRRFRRIGTNPGHAI
jgi:transcriptional regulator with GAF, ATPase, and Fis domain